MQNKCRFYSRLLADALGNKLCDDGVEELQKRRGREELVWCTVTYGARSPTSCLHSRHEYTF